MGLKSFLGTFVPRILRCEHYFCERLGLIICSLFAIALFFVFNFVFLAFFLFITLVSELEIENLRKMSTNNLPVIRSKVKTEDMPNIRSMLSRNLGVGYVTIVAPKVYTFCTVPDKPCEILVRIEAMRARLSFPLDPFTINYL